MSVPRSDEERRRKASRATAALFVDMINDGSVSTVSGKPIGNIVGYIIPEGGFIPTSLPTPDPPIDPANLADRVRGVDLYLVYEGRDDVATSTRIFPDESYKQTAVPPIFTAYGINTDRVNFEFLKKGTEMFRERSDGGRLYQTDIPNIRGKDFDKIVVHQTPIDF